MDSRSRVLVESFWTRVSRPSQKGSPGVLQLVNSDLTNEQNR